MPTLLDNLFQRATTLPEPSRRQVVRLWRYLMRKRIRAGRDPSNLDRLYALPDPWGMASEVEQRRFESCNALLGARLGRVGTLLEIGAGEGHQSVHLQRLCGSLHGVDVSARAVGRAQQRLPAARFGVGGFDALPWPLPEGRPFDLVVACEVLYYLEDVGAAVAAMSALGQTCFATFFAPAAPRVAVHLAGLEGLETGWFSHGGQTWLWAFWRPARHAAGAGPAAVPA